MERLSWSRRCGGGATVDCIGRVPLSIGLRAPGETLSPARPPAWHGASIAVQYGRASPPGSRPTRRRRRSRTEHRNSGNGRRRRACGQPVRPESEGRTIDSNTVPGERAPDIFSYGEAFARNIGWVTHREQQALRDKRVAIAGLGGVGGSHLVTLARLGIGRFSIADFDCFGLANFNRQAGATMGTLGRPKVRVLSEIARDINPEIELRVFEDGLTAANLDAFLDGVDLYVDGLDFFAFDARRAVFDACARRGIPAITVAPLGMGAALLNFLPGRMSFEEYFRWEGCDETERSVRFLVGLSPAFLQSAYLVDPSAVSLASRKGPSTGMACQLCAGIAGVEALKILLARGKVYAAPWCVQFDAYRNRYVRTWRPGGNRNPVQRLLMTIVRRRYRGMAAREASA